MARYPFSGIPSGWFMVSPSSSLRPGEVRSERYFGRDLVLYRTASGEPRVVDAFCPHLGAHLGRGKVEGETLRCPFHGFAFDGTGQCVRTPYPEGTPPRRARLAHYTTMDRDGMVLVYHDAGGSAPTWEPPHLDLEGYTPFRWHRYEIASHPQETSENSVDVGHFTVVHGFMNPYVRSGVETEGPLLRAQYGMQRRIGPRGTSYGVHAHFDVFVHGLGYSLVRTHMPGLRYSTLMLVNSTPVDGEHVHLYVGAAVQRLPVPGLSTLARRVVHQVLVHEVGTDIPIWEAKRYESRPALAPGDGEIASYRRWAAQFYPPAPTAETASAA